MLTADDDYEVRGINQAEGVNPDELTMFLTKSGTQLLEKSKWKLQQPDAGNTNRNFIEIENSSMKLFHVQDCTNGSDAWAANKGYVDNTAVLKTGNIGQIMEPSLGLLGGDEATGSNLYIANKGFVRWGYGAFETQGEYGGYIYMRDDTTFEIGTYKDVDLKFNATNPEFVHSPSVPDPSQDEHATNRKYVLDQIRANAGTDYTLPTATTSTKGGVTAATNSGTYVSCTKMANTGSNIGVIESTNTTKGVNYKGQACITNSSTPTASSYQQGALVFSTSTNSLYIRT